MGQVPRKWIQINQGQLGGPLGVHFRSPRHILGPLEGSEANSCIGFLYRKAPSEPNFILHLSLTPCQPGQFVLV